MSEQTTFESYEELDARALSLKGRLLSFLFLSLFLFDFFCLSLFVSLTVSLSLTLTHSVLPQ